MSLSTQVLRVLKTHRLKIASQESAVDKNETMIEGSSPPIKATKARRALGDVSNKTSQTLAVSCGGVGSTMATNGKQSLRRSRRISNLNFTREDRNLICEHETKTGLAPVPPRNPLSRGQTPEIQVTTNGGINAVSKIIKGAATNDIKLPSDVDRKPAINANRIVHVNKKTTDDGSFDIESVLLEPRPKRKRPKSKTRVTKKKKKLRNVVGEAEERSDEMHDSKMETPNVVLPVLPNINMKFNATSRRYSDLLISSDDDHCLLRKLEGPFDASKFSSGIATYDKANEGRVSEVPAYVTDIFQRLFYAEKITRPSPSYMTNEQQEINSTMRAILVDWLVGVQIKFRLQPETLYLCVNIIDRYLSRVHVSRRRLQLLGITALFVACKYEEIYPLEVKDCVYVTDRAYNRQEVLDMEFDVVMVLGFKMTVPTAYPFLQRFLHITNAPKMIRDLASFYSERMLQEYCMLNFRASLVASAAVYLAWNNPTAMEDFGEAGIAQNLPRVLDIIMNYTGFCEEEIRHTARVICIKIQPQSNVGRHSQPRTQLSKVHLKYRFEAYSNASCCELPKVSHFNP